MSNLKNSVVIAMCFFSSSSKKKNGLTLDYNHVYDYFHSIKKWDQAHTLHTHYLVYLINDKQIYTKGSANVINVESIADKKLKKIKSESSKSVFR